MDSLLSIQDNESILFLGEGNFTFSLSLVEKWKNSHPSTNPTIIATCFEKSPVSKLAEENVKKLKDLGVRVQFDVDATKCGVQDLSVPSLTKVIFMFPHVGGKSKIHLNRELIKNFATNIFPVLKSTDSKVIVTLCGGQGGTPFDPVQRVFGDTWQIINMMSFGNLQLTAVEFFDTTLFPDYSSYGYRGFDRGFHSEKGVVHVFEKSPEVDHSLPDYQNADSLCELREKYVDKKVTKFFSKTISLWKHFVALCSDINQIVTLPENFLHSCERKTALLVEGSFNANRISGDVSSPQLVFVTNFTLDFSRCPVSVCLLVPVSDSDQRETLKRAFKLNMDFTLHGTTFILFSVSNYAMRVGKYDRWQLMWTSKPSLYPPCYSHDLAYTFSREPSKISDEEMATVLWCFGVDSVTSFNLFDVYCDSEGRTSNTVRIKYVNYNFPMSKEKVWQIHYYSIGGALVRMFRVTLR